MPWGPSFINPVPSVLISAEETPNGVLNCIKSEKPPIELTSKLLTLINVLCTNILLLFQRNSKDESA